MKKIIGSILHIISLLAIVASILNVVFFYLINLIFHSQWSATVFGRDFIEWEIVFIIIAIITYYIGKNLKRIN